MTTEQEKEIRLKIRNIHCGVCGGASMCPGIVHEAEVDSIMQIIQGGEKEVALDCVKMTYSADDGYDFGKKHTLNMLANDIQVKYLSPTPSQGGKE